MAEQSTVGFLEKWQTGAFLVVSSVLGGVIALYGFGHVVPISLITGVGVFVLGTIVAFVALSFLIYGR
ncbi:hypothetical protein [Halorubrum gandharaense]